MFLSKNERGFSVTKLYTATRVRVWKSSAAVDNSYYPNQVLHKKWKDDKQAEAELCQAQKSIRNFKGE